jgi:hypothetical protein
MSYWMPFIQFGNLSEEEIIKIRQILEEEESIKFFNRHTAETYIPDTVSLPCLRKPPHDAMKFKNIITVSIYGTIVIQEVEGYKHGDILYLEFDD